MDIKNNMKYTETCECCGHVVTAFTHSLNWGLAIAFNKFMQKFYDVRRPINPNKELGLTHNQLANWQKLRYWDLIRQIDGQGLWIPTNTGHWFFGGTVAIPKVVATMNAERITSGHAAWETHTKDVELVKFSDLATDFKYKKRPEYQAEKSGQMNF